MFTPWEFTKTIAKTIGLYWLIVFSVYGCNSSEQITNNVKIPVNKCPEKPEEALTSNNVKSISLTGQTVKQSGVVSPGKNVGYIFEAESGQKLSYQTKEDICIWVYTPDSQLLDTSKVLPVTGKYTIQLSSRQGTTTFELEIGLDISQSPTPTLSPTPTPTSSPTPTPTSSPTSSSLSQKQAVEIVQNWLNTKHKIFGKDLNTSLINELLTGNFHYNLTNSDGSIAWLRNNNAYYTYNYSRIKKVISFFDDQDKPALTVSIEEELYLHTPTGIDQDSSGAYKADYTYSFQKDNGVWKISNAQKAN
ncbi:MAG: ARC6/PARC6 family protein [Gloeotrichia echinulata IR180]|nr:ARC6/PARC6 family protein [Gloeotrichia echinulata DEX184]